MNPGPPPCQGGVLTRLDDGPTPCRVVWGCGLGVNRLRFLALGDVMAVMSVILAEAVMCSSPC